MSTFNDDFDITLPVGSSFARNGQVELRKTRRSLQERFDLEHYGPGLGNQDPAHPGADGRHRPGKTSVTLLDTESNILATTPGASGALAFSTDKKILYFWNGTNWTSNQVLGANTLLLPTVDLTDVADWSYDGAAPKNPLPFTNAFDGSDSTFALWEHDGAINNPGVRVDLGAAGLYELFLLYSLWRSSTSSNAALKSSLETTNVDVKHTLTSHMELNVTQTNGVWSGKSVALFKFYGRYLFLSLNVSNIRIYRFEVRKLG